MAFKTKRPAFVPVPPRVIGIHAGCGGPVLYQVTPSMGWTVCTCGASSLRGTAPEVVRTPEPVSG